MADGDGGVCVEGFLDEEEGGGFTDDEGSA